MSQQSSLKTLLRVREQELEGKNRDVATIQQQLARVDSQVSQLQGYREDYRVHLANRQGDSTYRVQDRQLFLARLEQSIDALGQNRLELLALKEKALSALRDAYERTEALREIIARAARDQNQEKLRHEQSQCDEQGRLATNCRLGTGT